MVLLRAKDSDGHSSLAGWKHTPTTLHIENQSTCVLRRMRCESHQIDDWESFPEEIQPSSSANVLINFVTKRSIDVDEDHGECSYQVISPDEYPLSEVTISADASESEGLLGTFRALIRIRWGNLPNVFGMKVTPLDGNLGFKHKGTIALIISGDPLRRGDRVEDADGRTSDWMEQCSIGEHIEIGDIIAVDRGYLHHYGIAFRRNEDDEIVLAHLNGTAQEMLRQFGILDTAKQFASAIRKHGGIAAVGETSVDEFAMGDPVRIHNEYDSKVKPYGSEVIVERIQATLGYRDYSLREFNCEHYVHLMRYGTTYSGQIEEMKRLNKKFGQRLRESEEQLKKSISLSRTLDKIEDKIHDEVEHLKDKYLHNDIA